MVSSCWNFESEERPSFKSISIALSILKNLKSESRELKDIDTDLAENTIDFEHIYLPFVLKCVAKFDFKIDQ